MWEVVRLPNLVALQVLGSDARRFMQGQLTNDIRKVTPQQAVLGAHCNGQGRAHAIMTIVEREEGLFALLDDGMVEHVLARLRAFTLSAKVAFERSELVLAGIWGAGAQALVHSPPQAPGACQGAGAVTVLRWWDSQEDRFVALLPRTLVTERSDPGGLRAQAWRRADVLAGVPRVFPETAGSFVPQTLNLDLLAGVSYDKGCYVGQEVVARARRGGVSRRMFAFSAASDPPHPGTVVLHGEDEVGLVVDGAPSEVGSVLLAAVDLDHAASRLHLRGMAHADLSFASLPYAVPRERGSRPAPGSA